jgi:hypothetical protein
MSKYGEVFKAKAESQKSVNTETNKSVNTESYKSVNQDEETKMVGLGIKVSEKRRRHWVGQAKLQGTTVSDVIIEALMKRFGEPE